MPGCLLAVGGAPNLTRVRLGPSPARGPQDLRFRVFLGVIFSFTMVPFSAEEPLGVGNACLPRPLQAYPFSNPRSFL